MNTELKGEIQENRNGINEIKEVLIDAGRALKTITTEIGGMRESNEKILKRLPPSEE